MTGNEFITANDILDKFDFFNQRAGRELWNDKPVIVQNEDIRNFENDVKFLKDFINRQNIEIERLEHLIKDFAEKVKEETYHYYDSDIDNLVKESEGK